VLSADAKTGRAKVFYEETDPAWVNVNDDFKFLADGRVLITSERDGYRHLYLVGKDGKVDRQLTKGPWEVSSINCIDESAKRIYFTSTEPSPLERHLYSVSFDGKNKTQLTNGAGSHSINMGPGCFYYMASFSNLENPSRTVLMKLDNGKPAEVKVWREADRKVLEEYDILKTEIHTFKNSDGVTLYARLIKPANFDATKKYPVIVSIYGGPHAQSVRNSFAGLSWDQVMAHKGFVIWQVDNRGSSGRGHVFEAPVNRQLGKIELADQKDGIAYLDKLGFIDTKRVGITGWSYGGYMTLYCLFNAPETFQAGVAGAAVTDWRNYDTIYTERYMGLPGENEAGYKASAPVTAAGNLKGKLLLLHNIEDDNVLFANFMQVTHALQQANKPYQSLIYPQKSHGVSGKARTHMVEAQTKFFEEALK